MATSKGRGGAAKKSAAKKSTKSAGSRSGGNRGGAPSKAAASKGGKKAAAKKSSATKATATKKSAPAKSAARGAASAGRGSSRNGTSSRSAASRGRSTSAARGGAVASRNTSARSSSSKASADPRNDLEKILQDLMKDIYYAEKKLSKALGKMAKKTTNARLRDAFTTHQSQTEDQIQKLERAFEIIGQKPKAKKCVAMDGLVEESEEHMQEYEKGAGLDAALIVGAQKVEHYEIAAYGSMRSIAETLGYNDAARIFEEIRDQESDTDELLTQIAESVVNLEAEDEKDGEEGAGFGGQRTSMRKGGTGSEDSQAGEDSSSAYSGSMSNNGSDYENQNDGAGRGISSMTDGNDRGEMAETGPAMGY